ncbi:recombination regulator RecX [Anaerobacillus sp. CMMVII]|uniref:recombination regulator RecX n=1 Tax=Anaerobacillus sp. CMMVII TaxID=2755588 RepID=UPI0021B7BABC|nr:recombination regulator RecX [Anaerobacillus sp. CMMVII]MCT8136929.1 recombination regulator RecX [Anaerobacillus sp. CMMVII]
MPTISKITVQKKNKERYNIFLDEEYAFSVDEAILVTYHLRKGLEVTKEFLTEIISEDHIRKGYQSAINYLSYRIRSVKEVKDYLSKKELEPEVITRIVEKLTKENYLDDQEFARAYVQSRLNLTLKGPELVRRELVEKGISEADMMLGMQLYTYDLQLEKAVLFLQKKYPAKLRISRNEQDRKLYMLLISKGFSQEVIQQAFKIVHEEVEADNDEEWEALLYQGEKAYKKFHKESGWEQKQKVKQYLYRKGFSVDSIDKFIEYYEEEREK